jgi:hypothetical protein
MPASAGLIRWPVGRFGAVRSSRDAIVRVRRDAARSHARPAFAGYRFARGGGGGGGGERFRIAWMVLAAAALGVVVSAIKGNGRGLRDAIGNVRAPWLWLAFVARAYAGGERVVGATIVGTTAALLGFYVSNSFVLDLGRHAWVADLRLTVDSGRQFFVLALAWLLRARSPTRRRFGRGSRDIAGRRGRVGR